MSTTTTEDLREHITSLNLKDGDIIFYDPCAIDDESFAGMSIPGNWKIGISLVPVKVRMGQTVRDSIAVMTREELEAVRNE